MELRRLYAQLYSFELNTLRLRMDIYEEHKMRIGLEQAIQETMAAARGTNPGNVKQILPGCISADGSGINMLATPGR